MASALGRPRPIATHEKNAAITSERNRQLEHDLAATHAALQRTDAERVALGVARDELALQYGTAAAEVSELRIQARQTSPTRARRGVVR